MLVDFSSPKGFKEACDLFAHEGANIVSGTTPVPKEYQEEVEKSIKEYGIKWILATSFSPDVNKFFAQMEYVGEIADPASDPELYDFKKVLRL